MAVKDEKVPTTNGTTTTKGGIETNDSSFQTRLERLRRFLFAPVDIASLVCFRIAFGCIMVWEVTRYFDHNWIDKYYVNVGMTFHYYGFEWVNPWKPGHWMHIHFYVMGIMAACITVGFYYRITSTIFAFLFTYVFLLERNRYLNHLYLVSVISFLMVVLPVHREFSIDSWYRKPSIRSSKVPAYNLYLVQFIIAVPYFFGGVAKINYDWMFRAEPMRKFIYNVIDDLPASLVPIFEHKATAFVLAYAGMLLDLFVVPAFLWSKTRTFAYINCAIFHLSNSQLFTIGIFPWFMLVASLMYYPPDSPRRLLHATVLRPSVQQPLLKLYNYFHRTFFAERIVLVNGEMVLATTDKDARTIMSGKENGVTTTSNGTTTASNGHHHDANSKAANEQDKNNSDAADRAATDLDVTPPPPVLRRQYTIMALLGLYVSLHMLVPFRHLLYPGNVNWTEEGHDFSWHMKLRTKRSVTFYRMVDKETNETIVLDPNDLKDLLKKHQVRKFQTRPVMILEFAHFVAREFDYKYKVYADVWTSLNGRPFRRLIDPTVDLSTVQVTWAPQPWIIPMGEGDVIPQHILDEYRDEEYYLVDDFDEPLKQEEVTTKGKKKKNNKQKSKTKKGKKNKDEDEDEEAHSFSSHKDQDEIKAEL